MSSRNSTTALTADGSAELRPELPPVRLGIAAAVEAFKPIVSSVGRDLVRSIGEASKAVTQLGAISERDVSVSALTAVECVGATPAEALLAAADTLGYGDTLTVHGLLWARVPGPGRGLDEPWNYRVTVLASAIDPELGETEAPAHQADRGFCRVVLYLDADREVPEGALTALQRDGLTQAGAMQAAAEVIRRCPELNIEGLIWARVPARRAGVWEYRLTVLVSATAPGHGRTGGPTYLDGEMP